eukprot:4444615-Prymnesium_polylepis.1
MERLLRGATRACWRAGRGATRPLPPAAVAPPGDRQSPTSTVILGRQPTEAPSPPDGDRRRTTAPPSDTAEKRSILLQIRVPV